MAAHLWLTLFTGVNPLYPLGGRSDSLLDSRVPVCKNRDMNKRTQDTPWMVVDVMDNSVVDYFSDDFNARSSYPDSRYDIQYRPLRKRKNARGFP